MSEPNPPEGFEPHVSRGAFTTKNGPLFVRLGEEDGTGIAFGLRVAGDHCNGFGFMHGGMLAAFSDSAMAQAVVRKANAGAVTLSMTMEYFEPTHKGDWLVAEPVVVSCDDSVAQVDVRLSADGRLKARGAASFWIRQGRKNS